MAFPKRDSRSRDKPSLYEFLWNDTTATPEERMRKVLHFYVEDGRFDARCVRDTRVISVDLKTNTVVYEIDIQPYLCSRTKTLHGGAAATLLDMLTSAILTLLAKPGAFDLGHVSRTITMSYLRPVNEGQTVRIECRPVSLGKNTANVYGEIRTLEGKVCVTCVHDKVVFGSKI
ncbi:Thioesterase/thiol ester dehydrase-isomerase [Rhizodiscina lignyota]|uniref:Thioesterase/thiol ester dehydrase-isomerase n=1 Tax=Rhizodiscina lignyota TaxID=1504668 RepID=A0A9P4ILL2_9PEZI|nr:Thioesterase/thiol ester dehydrase-isomerase [Rhizodiscina lignyota]